MMDSDADRRAAERHERGGDEADGSDLPDWLKALKPADAQGAPPAPAGGTLGGAREPAPAPPSGAGTGVAGPLQSGGQPPASSGPGHHQAVRQTPGSESEARDSLGPTVRSGAGGFRATGPVTGKSSTAEPGPSLVAEDDLPGWLKALGSPPKNPEPSAAPAPPSSAAPMQPPGAGSLPSWAQSEAQDEAEEALPTVPSAPEQAPSVWRMPQSGLRAAPRGAAIPPPSSLSGAMASEAPTAMNSEASGTLDEETVAAPHMTREDVMVVPPVVHEDAVAWRHEGDEDAELRSAPPMEAGGAAAEASPSVPATWYVVAGVILLIVVTVLAATLLGLI